MAQITLNSSGVASSGSLLLQTNGTTTQATVDTSGNLGLGVTPSAWWSSFKALQVNNSSFGTYLNRAYVSANWYVDSAATSKYIASDYATQYLQENGKHIWYNAPSGTAGNAITFTQAMTLDSSGNLGIGTTSPFRRLEVSTTSTGTLNLIGLGTTGAGGQGMLLGVDTTNSYAFIKNNTSSSYGLAFFSGNGLEAARFDSSGNLLVGTTSSNRRLAVSHGVQNFTAQIENTAFANPYGMYILYSGAAPNNTASSFIQAIDTVGIKFDLRSNGGLANYSANNVNLSDRREKTNFAPAGEYLAKICAIPVQTFNYIDQNLEEDGGLTLGVVAQDVQAVAPELVMESNWAKSDEEPKMRLSIYQTDLQYALMKCIQEQQQIIEQLQADVAALKGQA